jgi:hypothetical protein
MKKMTAAEWLGLYIKGITSLNCDEIIEHAIKMEWEQMSMADKNGQDRNQYNHDLEYGGAEYWDDEPLEFEQWYNKTYGGDK